MWRHSSSRRSRRDEAGELRSAKTQKGFANVDSILENVLMRGEAESACLCREFDNDVRFRC